MLKEKLELGTERKTVLNRFIVYGKLESFVEMVDLLEKFNYDISHYHQTYERALRYLMEDRLCRGCRVKQKEKK